MRHHKPRSNFGTDGFTLVEMMVAVALVVIMMLMFASVFHTAGKLVSDQKGMAENDQSERMLDTLLRGDLQSRTFKDVIPFVAGQDPPVGFNGDKRKGYFSISENDPLNPTDDVLSLTICVENLPIKDEDKPNVLPYSGRATLLRVPEAYGGPTDADIDNVGDPNEQRDYMIANPDQPEFDDGQVVVNNTGSSEYAEVSWFLRNGVLYRRQLMIRRPYNRGGNKPQPEDPTDSPPDPADKIEFIPFAYSTASLPPGSGKGVFWNDFDYSAYGVIVQPDSSDPTVTAGEVKFHVTNDPESKPDSLDNLDDSPTVGLGGFPRSLGVPFQRFGSSTNRWRRDLVDPNDDPNDPNARRYTTIYGPREYLTGDYDLSGSTTPSDFIGRYTIQETSHSTFHYPGNPKGSDPFWRGGLSLDGNYQVSQYADEKDRRGEDIVMQNVHEFDIQVWDDLLGEFVNLGYSGNTVGDYHRNSMRLANGRTFDPTTGEYSYAYGNNTDFNNRFDTWHPHDFMPHSPPYAPFRDPTGTNPNPRRTDPDKGLGSEFEIPLKAVRIKIRFYDPNSQQMRDETFTFTLD